MNAKERIDVERVLAAADLLNLAGRATDLKRIGNYWAGPCPFCGGNDRFQVAPHHTPQQWLCRNCTEGRYQSAIDFVRKLHNLSFPEACEYLGGNLDPGVSRPAPAMRVLPPVDRDPPSAVWRSTAEDLVTRSEACLWLSEGAKARQWLMDRGLREETIQTWRLGYVPEDRFEDVRTWGVTTGKKSVWIPRGITIPCIADGHIWYVKIRRPVIGKGEQKFVKVAQDRHGLQVGLFGADQIGRQGLLAMCEGEFDCMLLAQEAGDLLAAATLGSATDPLDPVLWGRYLLPMRAVLAAYDTDEAGRKGMEHLRQHSERVYPFAFPALREGDKDITDFHRAGGNIAAWVAFELTRLGLLERPDPWPEGGSDPEDYCILTWPEGSPACVVVNHKARRLEDGRIEARYTREELELVVMVVR